VRNKRPISPDGTDHISQAVPNIKQLQPLFARQLRHLRCVREACKEDELWLLETHRIIFVWAVRRLWRFCRPRIPLPSEKAA